MAIDFNKPALTDNYTSAFVPNILANQIELARMLDSGLVSITGTPPTGAKRYNRTSSALEEWNGSAWVVMPLQGINFASGNIGLGVAPAFKLDVLAAAASVANFKSSGSSAIIRIADGTADTGYVGSGSSLLAGLARTDFGLTAGAGGALVLGSNNTERIRASTGGLVTVFAPSSGPTLQVNSLLGAAALRLPQDAAFIEFYNTANSARSGYLQIHAAAASRLWVEVNQALELGTNNTTRVTIGASGDATFTGALAATSFAGSGVALTALNASNLSSGTVPDARFPATLPALNGSNLTNLNASNLASGTVPNARTTASSTFGANTIVARDGNGDTAVRGLVLQNTAVAGNVLDWYEEGSWTPTVVGATTAGAASSYPVQSARYLRFGRLVYVEIELQWSGHTGSGVTRIQGLPWAAAFSRKTMRAVAGGSGLAVDAWTAETVAGQTYLQLYGINQNTGANSNRSIAANDTWWIQGFYEV